MKWLFASILLAPTLAFAQDATTPAPKSFAELYPALPGVEYYCTNAEGARIELGGVICVTASCSTWMAKCEMAASNRMAMWRKTQDGCPAVSVLDRLKAIKPTA